MRVTLASALLLSVVAALAAPRFIGIAVQRQFPELVPLPGYQVVVDRYERGWFSADVRWHVQPRLLAGGKPGAAAVTAQPPGAAADQPPYAFAATVRHGPVLVFRGAAQAPRDGTALHRAQAIDADRPWLGYVWLHVTQDRLQAESQPAAAARNDGSFADVVYGLWSGFTAHLSLPELTAPVDARVAFVLRGIDVTLAGDEEVQVAARIEGVERIALTAGESAGPFSAEQLTVAATVARAGASAWVWVGSIAMHARGLNLSVGATPVALRDLHVTLFSRLEDAGRMAAIVQTRAGAVGVGAQQLTGLQATLVAKSISATAVARTLELRAQTSALGATRAAMAAPAWALWRRDVVPAALKLSPVLVLSVGDARWDGAPFSVTGRARIDGARPLSPTDLTTAGFWWRRVAADVAARFANPAAQRVATLWPWWVADLTAAGHGGGESRAESPTESPAESPAHSRPQSLAEMVRLGRLVPTGHGYVANFAMQDGKAALNGRAWPLPGVAVPAVASGGPPAGF